MSSTVERVRREASPVPDEAEVGHGPNDGLGAGDAGTAPLPPPRRIRRAAVVGVAGAAGLAGLAWFTGNLDLGRFLPGARDAPAATPEVTGPEARRFVPSAAQLASFEVEPVAVRTFRSEDMTEGKIAINEDRNTPVYTPYAGRVVRILAKAGDDVTADQVLFTVEAADMVQALNDDQAAMNAVSKATSLVRLNGIVATRQQELFQAKAAALKDWQSAQNDLIAAQSDLRTSESALQAARNRLAILGKTPGEIAAFEQSGRMSPDTPIRSPLAGTIVQRKVGPGQYLQAGSDPPFVIGDLSTVWLVAQVRESQSSQVRTGQSLEIRVLAVPGRTFEARITYVASSVDPATRRLLVRAEIANPGRILKPEMFATFSIITGEPETSPAVPRNAVVYEGSAAHVWVVKLDGSVAGREVTLGLSSPDVVQVREGLAAGERIVTRGALFIDRAANGDNS